jgi:hypothetical protein
VLRGDIIHNDRIATTMRPPSTNVTAICPVVSADERAFAARTSQVLTPSRIREPRIAGGRYWSGYWAEPYSVESIEIEPGGVLGRIVVRWERDDRLASHFTAWNPKWDRIIEPAKAAPAETAI